MRCCTDLPCPLAERLCANAPGSLADATSAFYVRRKPLSATINTLANALYKVRRAAVGCCRGSCGLPGEVIQVCGLVDLQAPKHPPTRPHLLTPPPRAPTHPPHTRQVFCASDSKAHEEMRQACFDYLALGGVYSSE